MPRECAPLVLGFADLFDHLGTGDLRYSARAQTLSGREVTIAGFLAHAHGPRPTMLLVDAPGLCPDCSPAPAAVITLPGAAAIPQEGEGRAVRVTGRLDYGFRIDAGVASILRIEGAAVFPVEASA
jgi:hypothetical protein